MDVDVFDSGFGNFTDLGDVALWVGTTADARRDHLIGDDRNSLLDVGGCRQFLTKLGRQ